MSGLLSWFYLECRGFERLKGNLFWETFLKQTPRCPALDSGTQENPQFIWGLWVFENLNVCCQADLHFFLKHVNIPFAEVK